MFETVETTIPGVLELQPKVLRDSRGAFVKLFHKDVLEASGIETGIAEVYYSISEPDVVRGLHFQLPPHDHAKFVTCIAGAAFDVALDLRQGSPAFGRHHALTLSAELANMIYVPRGVAHGFCVTEGPATLLYMTTTVHAPEHDAGIRWDSAGIDWPVTDPVLSDRDRTLPALADFDSPFRYSPVSRS